ncbi:MAG: hypothetical protein JWM90_2211 [Thermoleophilia bacterium]|nr:hypothetical protein [Thermoleophilia bacterium]
MRTRTWFYVLSPLVVFPLLAWLTHSSRSPGVAGTPKPTNSDPGYLAFVVANVAPFLVIGLVLGWLLQPRRVRASWIAAAVALVAGIALVVLQPDTDDPDQTGALAFFVIMAVPMFVPTLVGAWAGGRLRSRRRPSDPIDSEQPPRS